MSSYGHAAFIQIEGFSNEQWRLPLSLAIAVHLLTFVLLVFPPTFFLPERPLEEIQTINLFTVDELQEKIQPPEPTKPQEPAAPPEKENAQSIAITPPAQQAPPVVENVISLKPRRLKKIIKKQPAPPAPPREEIQRQKALDRIQARVNQKREEEKLKHELLNLREALHSSAQESRETTQKEPGTPQQAQAPAPASQGTDAQINEAQRRYFIAVQRRILDNWALPKTQDWDANLESVIVIYIEKTGVVSKTLFEKKSKNAYFNQYVEKTIHASAPMPPIPSSLKKNRLEIGLRFRPSGLY